MEKTWLRLKENPQLWSRYHLREKVLRAIRFFFTDRGFHEVETPLLAPRLIPESYLEVFETTLLDRHRKPVPAYFTPSPEIFLKKLLVAGIGNCFSLTKSFRNTENLSFTHNPEFTLLEWYRVGADYKDLMKDVEDLFSIIYEKLKKNSSQRGVQPRSNPKISPQRNAPLFGSPGLRHRSSGVTSIIYQGQTIDLTPPWERLTMVQAFAKYAKVDLVNALTYTEIASLAQKKGYKVLPNSTWEELFNQIFLNEVEPHLGQGRPTIIFDYPSQMAALAQKKRNDPRFTERFEVYIAGLELGDCYSELTDWREQEERFKKEVEERRRLGKTDYPYDRDFIEALKVGLPKCAGLALGVDRVVMLFADTRDIADTLFFPAKEVFR